MAAAMLMPTDGRATPRRPEPTARPSRDVPASIPDGSRGKGPGLHPERLRGREVPACDESGRIVGIGAKGGKPRTLMKNPEAARDAENGLHSPFPVCEDSRFHLASDRVTGTSSGSPEKLLLVGKGRRQPAARGR